MLYLVQNFPSIENTELWSTYVKTHPQLYSSITTNDNYLLRYCSNIWNIQFQNCIFHPQTNSIILQTSFVNTLDDKTINISIPYQLLSALRFNQLLDPLSNSITLEALCEIYLLYDSVILRLPTTSQLSSLYPNLITNDGLIIKIPLKDIKNHTITNNLTKLSLSIANTTKTDSEITLYPLQRFPPQPLASGMFQYFANLTPLDSLHVVQDSISQGITLVNALNDYVKQQHARQENHHPSISRNGMQSPSPIPGAEYHTTKGRELMLSQSGQGDDDDYNFIDNDGNDESMQVEIIGGFQSSGTKRSRRESDENNSNHDYCHKSQRHYSPEF